jgi:hypothetical protein
MSNPQQIASTFATNLRIIKRQTDGLTHADSLMQPPFRGNCLNWVLGHIIVGRNRALVLLGQEPVWGEEERILYETGSDAITSGDKAVDLQQLLSILDQAQARLASGLEQATAERLAAKVTFLGQERTVAEAVAGLAWHETYHTGQTELLRQLTGKADKVI